MADPITLAERREQLERAEGKQGRVVDAMAGGPHASDMTREEIDAKIAQSQAESATVIAQAIGHFDKTVAELKGDLKALDTKVSSLPGRWTIFGAALTAVGLVLAGLAFGNDMFSRGFTSSDVATAAATKAVAAYAATHPPPKP